MSSPPQSLIERLLEGLRNVQDPAFIAADFGRNWPDQTSAFLAERILKKIPPAETPYIPGVGYRQIITIGGKEYLTDPDAPGSSFEPLDFDLSRLQLDEKRFVQWIADGNSLDDVREFSGAVWLMGKCVLHGWQTNVFYMRPGWDVDRLGQIAALARDTSEGEMFLLVAASFAGISLETLRRVTPSRFATATLFSLVEGERINLEKCQLPQLSLGEGEPNIFSRTGSGWTVRYGGGQIHGFPDVAGMHEIWFLLRNPGKEFTSAKITNALAGIDEKDAPIRVRGSTARSRRDLPKEAKEEFVELMREKEEAEETGASATAKRVKGEIQDLLKRFGITDSIERYVAREGDVMNAEVERIYKALGRAIDVFAKTDGLEHFAKHLRQFLARRSPLSYQPDQPVDWRT